MKRRVWRQFPFCLRIFFAHAFLLSLVSACPLFVARPFSAHAVGAILIYGRLFSASKRLFAKTMTKRLLQPKESEIDLRHFSFVTCVKDMMGKNNGKLVTALQPRPEPSEPFILGEVNTAEALPKRLEPLFQVNHCFR